MESTYAHIENGLITEVEVVTDKFVSENADRYSNAIKVGEGSNRPYCGKGDAYISETDTIVSNPGTEYEWNNETKEFVLKS